MLHRCAGGDIGSGSEEGGGDHGDAVAAAVGVSAGGIDRGVEKIVAERDQGLEQRPGQRAIPWHRGPPSTAREQRLGTDTEHGSSQNRIG